MEDMELDQVVLVPDSPDRVDIRHINVERSKNQSNSSVYGSSLRENRNNGRRHWHPQRNPIDVDGYEPQNRSGTFSSFGNSPTQDGPFVRKAPMINNFNHESGLPTEQQHVDKGKKPIEQDDLNSIFNMTFPLGTSKNYDEERKGQTSSSNRACLSHSNPFPSRRSSSSYKGKEKIDCGGSNGSGLAINDQNVIDLSRGSPDENIEQVPMVHLPANLPRVPGCRRLVRNGCISPINIASHVQKSSESRHGGCSFVEKGQGQEMISDSQLQADIKEIVKESNNGRRSKGKEVLTSPTSHKHTTEAIYASRSNPVSSGKMTNQVNGACVQPSCSWRTMCNHASKNVRQSAAGAAASFVSEQHEKRASLRDNYVTTRLNSRSSPGLNRTSESYPKRQKRLGPTLETNHSSSAVSHDVEVLFLGSDHGLSSSRPSRLQSSQHDRVSHGLNTSSQVNETSPRTRRRGSQVTEHVDNDDSYARARQVEEDERLAREIQEQLYFEAPIFVADEINVDTASALQQEEYFNEHLLNDAVISMANEIDEDYVSFVEFGLPAVSSQNHTRSFNVNSSTLGPSGRGRSQSSSSRRANQAQAPTSGTLQWRTGFFNQPSATTSRQRRRFVRAPIARPSRSTSTSRVSRRFYPASARGTNISFPQGLDLDMGINMIEELGVAFLNEMSAGITFSNFIDGPLDVNGTDYEMWLALDENNHQSGVPIDRINSLPESVVQTENSEEICAICLETPATGETIRHLPCLHKFHKDCIDPWLSRKTTCPMCKASIA